MKCKSKLKNKSKDELINDIRGYKGNIGRVNNLLVEYKVTILFLNRQIELLKKKLKFLEGKMKGKRTYCYLGSRFNRDIGTMKKRNKKSYEQRRGR